MFKRYYFYWLAAIMFVADLVTKKIIETQMTEGQSINVIPGFFDIYSHRNRGAAFGILQDQRVFFIILTVIVVVLLIWLIQKERKTGGALFLCGLGLILGGALGNFYERLLYGQVVDFLQLTFGTYVFPIFNVADSAITVGAVCLIIAVFLQARKEKLEAHKQDQG
jgi:signal peptidase II